MATPFTRTEIENISLVVPSGWTAEATPDHEGIVIHPNRDPDTSLTLWIDPRTVAAGAKKSNDRALTQKLTQAGREWLGTHCASDQPGMATLEFESPSPHGTFLGMAQYRLGELRTRQALLKIFGSLRASPKHPRGHACA